MYSDGRRRTCRFKGQLGSAQSLIMTTHLSQSSDRVRYGPAASRKKDPSTMRIYGTGMGAGAIRKRPGITPEEGATCQANLRLQYYDGTGSWIIRQCTGESSYPSYERRAAASRLENWALFQQCLRTRGYSMGAEMHGHGTMANNVLPLQQPSHRWSNHKTVAPAAQIWTVRLGPLA